MSAQTAGPETLGHLSDAPPPVDPNSKKAKAITGKSPMRIAMGRLMRDKIAVVCLAVVILFALIAIFAGAICAFFNVTTDTVLPSQYLDFATTGLEASGIALALFVAAGLVAVAFRSTAVRSKALGQASMYLTVLWVAIAFLLVFQVLWIVFLLAIVAIWPFRSVTPK